MTSLSWGASTYDTAIVNDDPFGLHEVSNDLDLSHTPASEACEATRSGDRERLQAIIPHLTNDSSIAPKSEAIKYKRYDILRLLFESNNYVDEHLIKTACERKDRPSIKIFLASGWSPSNTALIYEASILCFAIDDLDFMKWMIEHGADVNQRSQLGTTVLSTAIARGHIDVVRFLLEQVDTRHGDLLHCAAMRPNQDEGAQLVGYLVRQGSNVNSWRCNNSIAFKWRALSRLPSPLHIACQERNIPVARALLEHGADPSQCHLEARRLVPPTPYDLARESKDEELLGLFPGPSDKADSSLSSLQSFHLKNDDI